MDQVPFALERFLARYEFSAPHLLSTSDCEGLAMADLVAGADPELRQHWGSLRLGYTESQGSPDLRAEIATLYETVGPEEILVAAPQEAIFLAMNALLEPGDHVVCTFPGYQSLYQMALSLGCEVTFWEPSERDSWRFDPERLRECCRSATKLMVWNFPHNPTGALPAHAEFAEMLETARAAGAYVFSDEMYRLLEPSAELRLAAAVDHYSKAISFSGMSKVFGLAGLRIGWVATHDGQLLEKMSILKDYTTICNGAPSELLALMALRRREMILGMHRRRVERNLGLARHFFSRHAGSFDWVPPRAGTVCFPRLKLGPVDQPADFPARRATGAPAPPDGAAPRPAGAAEFCDRALREAGVLLLPSTVYDYGNQHFRLGLGRDDFPAGLAALEAYTSSLDE